MIPFLTVVSIFLALAIVGVVVAYLVLIVVALKRAADHLEQLAGGLVQIRNHTRPLEGKVGTINGGLARLVAPLLAVDGNLARIVEVARSGGRG
jgi:hypothetical protein